ncbi:MAG: metallophosphoesterase [Nevskia sp.]|nr:metallophosphoesterase [Nevskia sp.]
MFKRKLLSCALTAFAFWFPSIALCKSVDAEIRHVIVLHDNDLHGHLESFCYIEKGRTNKEDCERGGAARRATLISKLREQRGANAVLVNAGDTFTRGPLTAAYEGIADIEAMNAVGYDVGALGNNEFKAKDGIEREDAAGAQGDLLRFLRRSHFPWICANVLDEHGALLPGVQPFIVRDVGGLRIAFLGLTTPNSTSYPQVKGWTFRDPVEAATEWIPKARAEADVVIAVTHLGVDADRDLVQKTRGVDAVIGGHSHTFLYTPIEENNLDAQVVPIVQDGEFGVDLGRLDLTFVRGSDGSWRLRHFHDVLIPVDVRDRLDPKIAALVQRYAAPLEVPVGRLPAPVAATLATRRVQTGEQLAVAFRNAAHAELGLHPEGFLYEVFRRRTVRPYDIRAILPFKLHVVAVQVPGDRLCAVVKKESEDGPLRLSAEISTLDCSRPYRVGMLDSVAKSHFDGLDAQDTDVLNWDAVQQSLEPLLAAVR